MSPLFIDLKTALLLHEQSINRYGGTLGMRDRGLLESALAQGEASFGGEFLHEFPAGMAAAYLFHVFSNHPFLDGNKRTAVACAFYFLRLNRFRLDAGESEFEELVLRVAQGAADKGVVTDFFRRHIRAETTAGKS